MQFSENHIAIYGASFKAHKVMLPPLKCQIFFLSKFVLFTQLSRKQIQFSETWLCHCLVYTTKYPHAKIKNIHRVDPEKNVCQTHRQADGRMNRIDHG